MRRTQGGRARRPGSDGEHLLQELCGSTERAGRFYDDQMLDVLTPRMVEFIGEQSWFIVSTADPDGHPAGSPRWGETGFVAVIDDHTVAWPELRGNGVMTSLGNMVKNPFVHLMFLDFERRIGLHLNGQAVIVEADAMATEYPTVAERPIRGRQPERWVRVDLDTDYIHCRKHFPASNGTSDWGTDDTRAKGGDYFEAKTVPSPWSPEKMPADGTRSTRSGSTRADASDDGQPALSSQALPPPRLVRPKRRVVRR